MKLLGVTERLWVNGHNFVDEYLRVQRFDNMTLYSSEFMTINNNETNRKHYFIKGQRVEDWLKKTEAN
jgi:hypothetical protein